MKCTAKHTKYQPGNSHKDWHCPRCGSFSDAFYIDVPDPEAHEDCDKLHDDDYIICETCGYDFSGKKVASMLAKEKNLIICPCCKGKGMIVKESVDE